MNNVLPAAQELIHRHGRMALGIAQDRSKKFERVSDWVNHRLALPLLTEVERLLKNEYQTPSG